MFKYSRMVAAYIASIGLSFRRYRIKRKILKTRYFRTDKTTVRIQQRRLRFEGVDFYFLSDLSRKSTIEGLTADDARPIIVMLHGFLDSATTFRRMFPYLLEDYHILAIDLPGFGQTQLPDVREIHHLPAISNKTFRFLEHLLKSLRRTREIYLLTHSMGGIVAFHMENYRKMSKRPLFFKKTAMLCPGILRLSDDRVEEMRSRLFPTSIEEARTLLENLYHNSLPELSDLVLSALIREWSSPAYQYLAANTLERLDEVFFQPEDFKRYKLTACILWGENDRLTPAEYGKIIVENMPDAELVMIPGAGHALHLEKPDSVARQISSFLFFERPTATIQKNDL